MLEIKGMMERDCRGGMWRWLEVLVSIVKGMRGGLEVRCGGG